MPVTDQSGIGLVSFVVIISLYSKSKLLGDEAGHFWWRNWAGDTWFDTASGKSGGVRDVTSVSIDIPKPAPFSAIGLLSGKVPDS